MLQGWKNMNPEQHYIQDHVDLYEHIDDPAYLKKEETFESWYEGAVRNVVGIRCGAISGNMKVSFQAARSIG
jgi:hypothetical protein